MTKQFNFCIKKNKESPGYDNTVGQIRENIILDSSSKILKFSAEIWNTGCTLEIHLEMISTFAKIEWK